MISKINGIALSNSRLGVVTHMTLISYYLIEFVYLIMMFYVLDYAHDMACIMLLDWLGLS